MGRGRVRKLEKVVIFGRGKFYQENKENLSEKYEIICFLDNGTSVGGQIFEAGIPVYNPVEFRNEKDYLVIIMVKQFVEIFYQLVGLGVDPGRITFGSLLFPGTERERAVLEQGWLKNAERKLMYHSVSGEKILIEEQKDFNLLANRLVREAYRRGNPAVQTLTSLPVSPVSRDFGTGRGCSVDRYYIEKFLESHKEDIRGDVLEIADNAYTLKYGVRGKTVSHVLHVNGWGNTIKGNLETGEGLAEGQFDALIITQTLMFIYDLKKTARNIHRIMRNNATALITVAGISQVSRYDADNWGSYWGFHEDALKKLFIPLFDEENVKVESYGNAKTAVAMLYGLCCEELEKEDFQFQDPDYPVILTVCLKKRG